jgi:hypothetical protein
VINIARFGAIMIIHALIIQPSLRKATNPGVQALQEHRQLVRAPLNARRHVVSFMLYTYHK